MPYSASSIPGVIPELVGLSHSPDFDFCPDTTRLAVHKAASPTREVVDSSSTRCLLSAHENGHRHDTGAARGRTNQ